MKIIKNIKLIVIKPANDYRETLCEVYLDGVATQIYVRGEVLEQALYVADNRYLLFTTDNVIFEESLNIYLIEIGRGVLDKLWVGVPYETDSYSGCEILDEYSLRFSFIYKRDWQLLIYQKPAFRVSFYSFLAFLTTFRLKRYLRLKQMPKS
ncbi:MULTISPECIES: hypothetical protein [Acinetobacter]|uniref:Uncharacterized protein n=1 Tax=Acinetobacter wuhouensis TaxID=1879050 RepID=A0A4Q7AJF6_9GAMM|nr:MULTISPECIES: hypothetical protein [Acinetobacter]RZG48711.1 hypothetical protein EXU28_02755 [Acinetobacter wuhouensis]RZG72979.1 hypothetical protein EXU29_08635 [Acinetobacter wuhouensis]RZG75057.1 hypothetical protein EXE09_11530 [Acinetobacter sp. WCHAc060025]